MITSGVDKILNVDIVFWNYCYVLCAWNNLWSTLQIKLSKIMASNFNFSRKIAQCVIDTPARLL